MQDRPIINVIYDVNDALSWKPHRVHVVIKSQINSTIRKLSVVSDSDQIVLSHAGSRPLASPSRPKSVIVLIQQEIQS